MRRGFFDVSRILDEAGEAADAVRRELAMLADDLNSGFSPDYEVTLVHLDAVDYLAFTQLRAGMNYNPIDQEGATADGGDLDS